MNISGGLVQSSQCVASSPTLHSYATQLIIVVHWVSHSSQLPLVLV